jgi:putative redox protein
MESVLMALAGCSAIDVEMILKKMRQDCKDIKVEVEATRADAVPAVFTKIHMNFVIIGDVKPEKVQQAVEMSLTQYCSVAKMLEKSVEITWKAEVEDHRWNEEM